MRTDRPSKWRAVTDKVIDDVVGNFVIDAKAKYISGRAEHGGSFNGDPLTHLREELIDAIFYADAARRERTDLLNELNELRGRGAEAEERTQIEN